MSYVPYLKTRNAFSLVELSIVLVILGLLVGGVLSGQSLIHAAELRSVTKDVANYQTALNSFSDRYFASPGDMTNAVKFWGAASGPTTDGYNVACDALLAATGTETCNGDGNGVIQLFETFRAWQQLSNAALIEGKYNGAAPDDDGYDAVPGQNVPASRIRNAGYTLAQPSDWNGIGALFYAPDGSTNLGILNALIFGTRYVSADSITQYAAIIPEDAWNIDTKIDDGKPKTGRTTAVDGITPCISGANYALSDSGIQCALVFYVR